MLNAPLYYLPEGLYGAADQIVKEDGRSVFGKHHYVMKSKLPRISNKVTYFKQLYTTT